MSQTATPDQKVLVFDFGAQYGQLIARRVRDLHVYSEIVPCDISAEEVRAMRPSAIILSGGPASVYAEDAPSIDPDILALGIPVLGFCYGQQAMAVALGGEVSHTEKGEYGPALISRCAQSALFEGTPGEQTVWMSHRDAVSRVPEGFTITSRTEVCPVASMEYPERKLYATQFHPEVRHTEFGQTMLRNFLFGVCGLVPDWTMDSIIDDSVAAIREKVGDNRVILGLSGGVDSSDRDAVSRVPEGFTITSRTEVCPVASMEYPERKLYATQFHPEVRHTEFGQTMLRNFLFGVCGLVPDWTMDSIIDDSVAAIRQKVGDNRVILGLSGGVDSSVVAALCARAIGKQLVCVFVNHGLLRKNEPEEVEEVFTKQFDVDFIHVHAEERYAQLLGKQLVCVFVNHGLLRKNEPEEVEEVFTKQFDVDFIHVHAEERYAQLLAGVTDPEEKRRIIGTQFWKEFFAVAEELDGVKFLAQGTIYPDIIESGARKTGGKASTIKSHHNLIPFPPGVSFELIEPLDHFFKDEVRALGTALGLPDYIVHRQPFPGPGLAIRIIGEVTPEKLEILKNADAIVREELDAYNERLFAETGERNSEHSVWQYFAVLPDIKSVGVMGDERTYARPIILRAVESSDAMTADWARLPYDVLARISGRIVAEVPGVNRVVYDITSKPPATIEWE